MGASQWQNWCPTDICICNFTGLPSSIHTYGHNLYMQVLDVSLAVTELVPCTRLYIYRCVHTVQLYTHL